MGYKKNDSDSAQHMTIVENAIRARMQFRVTDILKTDPIYWYRTKFFTTIYYLKAITKPK